MVSIVEVVNIVKTVWIVNIVGGVGSVYQVYGFLEKPLFLRFNASCGNAFSNKFML
jgi:hypothetical protein